MARKKKLYTVDELKALKDRLLAHRRELTRKVKNLAMSLLDSPPVNDACDLRDMTVRLASTCYALMNIDNLLGYGVSLPFDYSDTGLDAVEE